MDGKYKQDYDKIYMSGNVKIYIMAPEITKEENFKAKENLKKIASTVVAEIIQINME